MENITENRTFLENLVRSKVGLKNASELEIASIVEILYNAINTGFNLTKSESKQVAKNLTFINKLLESDRQKKLLLSKEASILPLIQLLTRIVLVNIFYGR
jgi:hypothetical protein